MEQIIMSVNCPNIVAIFIMIWFVVSLIVAIIGNVVFLFWLKRRGVNLVFALTGIPGYMDHAYFDWCRSHGCSSKRILVLRAVSIINVIVASIFFVVLVR
jgi:hypothetical protein